MKTLNYCTGTDTSDLHDQGEARLREKRLEKRLSNRDDVRDIVIVTTPPAKSLKGRRIVNQAVSMTETKFAWAMHWAIRVGDSYFELQRAHDDPTRTGLRMSQWDADQKSEICDEYPQGSTALTDKEIQEAGNSYFSKLDRLNFNNYSMWHHNCQIVVDKLLQDIGGLSHLRAHLKSLEQAAKGFFCDSIIAITTMYYRQRRCDEEIIVKHKEALGNALEILTARSVHYPKRQWIKEDISKANSIRQKAGSLGDHWLLSILESSLSLRKAAEFSYVQRGPDGKPELKFELVKDAVKGIFDEGKNNHQVISWLKALPWLAAGFVVGTPRWAVAVMALASQALLDTLRGGSDLKAGLENSLIGVGLSPKLDEYRFQSPNCRTSERKGRRTNSGKSGATSPISDNRLTERYELHKTNSDGLCFRDRKDNTIKWTTPAQQELGLMIRDIPLSGRWEEIVDEARGARNFIHRITGDTRNERPGPTEKWVTKKRTSPNWVVSSIMPLPCGWQMHRTEEGEKYYINHNANPPTTHTMHPMRQEIEEERRRLIVEDWTVEWDDDRGKKYRNPFTGEIRWKAIDGPQDQALASRPKLSKGLEPTGETFIEPLPPGWQLLTNESGQSFYVNQELKQKRTTHPNDDKRQRAGSDWEMRYNEYGLKYWVHHGTDGRGSSWWTRNKLLKNTSLKNDACGWKLDGKSGEWVWFQGGDIRHSDVPVADLDDPAEFELREYPFIIPSELFTPDGFLEPLPSNWVRRVAEEGKLSYFDFENDSWSDQHPYEQERQVLKAMWEMRYTRHGRQYFLNHSNGFTYWNNPSLHKDSQELRAYRGQKQSGWKLDPYSRKWVSFEELPNIDDQHMASQEMILIHNGEDVESQDGAEAEALSTRIFAQDWLNGIRSDEKLVRLQKLIQQQSKNLSTETLLRTTQMIMTYGKQLRDDERLVNILESAKTYGVNENLQNRVQQLKNAREKVRRRLTSPAGLIGNEENDMSHGEERRGLQKRTSGNIVTKATTNIRRHADGISRPKLYERASDALKSKETKGRISFKGLNRKQTGLRDSSIPGTQLDSEEDSKSNAELGNETSDFGRASTKDSADQEKEEPDTRSQPSMTEGSPDRLLTGSSDNISPNEEMKLKVSLSIGSEENEAQSVATSRDDAEDDKTKTKSKSLSKLVKSGRKNIGRHASDFRQRIERSEKGAGGGDVVVAEVPTKLQA